MCVGKTAKGVHYVSHICLYVCPQGVTQLQLDGCLSNLINSQESLKKIQVSLKSEVKNGYFTRRPRKLMVIYCRILLSTRNISEQIRKKIKTKSVTFLWDNVQKYGRVGQATDGNLIWRMRFACCRYGVVLCTTYTAYFTFRAKDSVMRTRSLRN